MPFKSPRDTVTSVHAIGCAKAGLGNSRLFILGILAGAYIAFGGLLAVIVGGGMPGIEERIRACRSSSSVRSSLSVSCSS